MKAKLGRKTLLEKLDITQADLEAIYREEGSYSAVARRLGTTKRTVLKYLSRHGQRRRGRRKGDFYSPVRAAIHRNPDLLRVRPSEITTFAEKSGLSPTYARAVLYNTKKDVEKRLTKEVRKILRENRAISDTKDRLIPVAAIRAVWIPRWEWDRPVYIRAILRDGTRTKLPTLFVPRVEDFTGRSDSSDQRRGTTPS